MGRVGLSNFSLRQLMFVTLVAGLFGWMIIPAVNLPDDQPYNENRVIRERADLGMIIMCVLIPMVLTVIFKGGGCMVYFMNAILFALVQRLLPHGQWQCVGTMAVIMLNGLIYILFMLAVKDEALMKELHNG